MIERHAGDPHLHCKMTPVGFEPTQLALVELESTPLDHSGKVSRSCFFRTTKLTYKSLMQMIAERGFDPRTFGL